VVAGSTKRLPSRFYQIKTGHCLPGQYFNWRKYRPTQQCWCCRYSTQTREHLPKVRLEWKAQKTMLSEVRRETVRWKDRWTIRDLVADERCCRAVLNFLSTTDVGRRVPADEKDAVSAVSELELREWLEERSAEEPALFLSTPHFMVRRNGIGGEEAGFLCPISFVLLARSSFLLVFSRASHFRGIGIGGGEWVVATCHHCADSGQEPDCT